MRHDARSVMAAGLLLLACLPISARADLSYTTTMSMGAMAGPGGPAGKPQIENVTYVKGKRQRVEMNMTMGPLEMHNVTLTMCDKDQTVQLDPDLKIYTVAPIGAPMTATSMRPPLGGPGAQPEAGGGTGHETVTLTVHDMGTEKIGDLTTHHSMITMETQTSGCLGDSDRTMKMEVWTADIPTFVCPAQYEASRTVDNGNGCHVTYDMKGDVDAMKAAMSGMIVQQKIYNGDQVMMTSTLKTYSQKDLDQALFEVPPDYKEVTQQEFQQQRMQEMMKRFRPQIPGH